MEFGGEGLSVKEIEVSSLHTNHALHMESAMDNQIITDSSRDRLLRGNELIAQSQFNPLDILRDKGGKGLPICRDMSDDPDDENTLATVVFNLSSSRVNGVFMIKLRVSLLIKVNGKVAKRWGVYFRA